MEEHIINIYKKLDKIYDYLEKVDSYITFLLERIKEIELNSHKHSNKNN